MDVLPVLLRESSVDEVKWYLLSRLTREAILPVQPVKDGPLTECNRHCNVVTQETELPVTSVNIRCVVACEDLKVSHHFRGPGSCRSDRNGLNLGPVDHIVGVVDIEFRRLSSEKFKFHSGLLNHAGGRPLTNGGG